MVVLAVKEKNNMNKISRNFGNLIMCIAEILIGVLLLINPVGFTSGVIVVMGIAMTVIGIGSLIGYFRSEPEEASRKNGLSKGLLLILAGIFCIFESEWFIVTFPLLTVFYGILTLMTGISKVQWAVDMLRMKQKYWFVAIIGAVLTLVFAALILTDPFASTAILWTFIAVTLIVEAVVDIVTFLLGRISASSGL